MHITTGAQALAELFDVDVLSLLASCICLLTAFLLGTLIGLERQWRQRTAGLRTNVLVAVGAAAFVDLGLRTAGPMAGCA
jgi:putative Mg2+ transporter-C (MgtC) family protein